MTLTIDVAMIGPSGAGKTSLLASMYSEFAKVTAATKVVLAPKDATTSVELSRYRAELAAIGRQLVVREVGIAGTRAFRQHTFSLRDVDHDKGSHIDIRFSDYPGGWLTDPHTAHQAELEKMLKSSDIMMIAIDTPAMIAEDGRFHHELNAPQLVRDIVQDWLTDQRRLLMLVPLKCEAWAGDEGAARELCGVVQKEYNDLIAIVTARDTHPAVVISPVQTVGSLIFDSFQVDDDTTITRFRGRKPRDQFDPKWTAEPVRLVIAHALRRQQSSRGLFKVLTDYLTGEGHHLRIALDKLSKQALGPSMEVD